MPGHDRRSGLPLVPTQIWIGVAALIFLGVMMIADPDAMADAEGTGRRALYQVVFKAVWGVPAGVVCLLAAGALGYFNLRRKTAEEEEGD